MRFATVRRTWTRTRALVAAALIVTSAGSAAWMARGGSPSIAPASQAGAPPRAMASRATSSARASQAGIGAPIAMSPTGMGSMSMDTPTMDARGTTDMAMMDARGTMNTASMCSVKMSARAMTAMMAAMKMHQTDMDAMCAQVAGAHKRVAADTMAMGAPGAHGGRVVDTSGAHNGMVSVTQLLGPRTAAHVRTFTLVARPNRLALGHGVSVNAWTYNGTGPGPVLRVRQGDLVVVHLVNRLPVPTTIHWHGIAVPNGEDGVAGSTQDAVAPGHTYTYRFVATDPGTYWYHAHQDSLTQVARGLYGMLVVAPAAPRPRLHDDVDVPIALHEWQIGSVQKLSVNGGLGVLRVTARPGSWVRLRLLNTDNTLHVVTVVGAPFTVAALDGHDLNGPQPLAATLLPIGSAQRYDVRFRMPTHGAVALRLGDDVPDDAARGPLATRLIATIGAPAARPVTTGRYVARTWFNLTAYGQPRPGGLTLHSHVDATYTLRLGAQTTLDMTHLNPTFTINGLASPQTQPIMVHRGEVVRLHIVNDTRFVHPMHLHGHTLAVLARDGRALRGSPVSLDTLAVFPGESYDVDFVADNPGIWMLHCHNMVHARYGMMLMVMYAHVTTPFKDGGPAGNVSD